MNHPNRPRTNLSMETVYTDLWSSPGDLVTQWFLKGIDFWRQTGSGNGALDAFRSYRARPRPYQVLGVTKSSFTAPSCDVDSLTFGGTKSCSARPVPTQNCFRFGHCRHFPESLGARSTTDLGERNLRRVGEEQPGLDLGFEDAVLGRRIFVPQQEFPVGRPDDVRQHASPGY